MSSCPKWWTAFVPQCVRPLMFWLPFIVKSPSTQSLLPVSPAWTNFPSCSCLAIRWRVSWTKNFHFDTPSALAGLEHWERSQPAYLYRPAWLPWSRAAVQVLAEWVRKPENADAENEKTSWVVSAACGTVCQCFKGITFPKVITWIIYSVTVPTQDSGS